MKILLLAILALSALNLFAATPEQKKSVLEAQRNCGNFVRFDENYLFQGFGSYKILFEDPRLPIPGKFTMVNLADQSLKQFATNDSALDIASYEGSAFILTYSSVEEWDLALGDRIAEYPTHTFSGVMNYKQHAEGFAKYQDKLIIAHGRLGVSFFDLKTKKVTKTLKLLESQLPKESQATAVAVKGNLAFVTMDSFSIVSNDKLPFSGIIVIDMDSEKVIKELGGMDIGSDAVSIFGNKLIVSFYGHPIWKYDLTQFRDRKLPEPSLRMFKFPVDGHPVGSATMDEKYYYTCFMQRDEDQRTFLKPVALHRKALMLD